MARIEIIEATYEDKEPEKPPSLPAMRNIKILKITVREILKGSGMQAIWQILKDSGYQIGHNKCYELIRMAKQEIVKRGEKDISVNYGWAQANLMDIHKRAVEENDTQLQIAMIDRLIVLWGLNRPHGEVKEAEITDEMIEEFEQRLLR